MRHKLLTVKLSVPTEEKKDIPREVKKCLINIVTESSDCITQQHLIVGSQGNAVLYITGTSYSTVLACCM